MQVLLQFYLLFQENNLRILLIEDDPDLNNQIKNSLEDVGYSVDTAVDGEEGHFLGDTEPYDAVVLDLGLPKIDGITVLEKWRKDKKNFPVLILTARDQWRTKFQVLTQVQTIMLQNLFRWKNCCPTQSSYKKISWPCFFRH